MDLSYGYCDGSVKLMYLLLFEQKYTPLSRDVSENFNQVDDPVRKIPELSAFRILSLNIL